MIRRRRIRRQALQALHTADLILTHQYDTHALACTCGQPATGRNTWAVHVAELVNQ